MDTALSASSNDLYTAVTGKLLAAIAAGTGEFEMPWHSRSALAIPHNASTRAAYRGINIMCLWLESRARGYQGHSWASYRQWQKLGAQVKKGERGTPIIFYKPLEIDEEAKDEEGQASPYVLHVLRTSFVFNEAQVSGYTPPPPEYSDTVAPSEQIEAFVSATRARVRYGFRHACYRQDLDDIEMPHPAWFIGSSSSTPRETFYATLLHELTHWSGASHRLDRQFGKVLADQAYAFEELVAELGAAYLCAAFGIANKPRPDHAAYLAHWLAILEGDRKAIFRAAAMAQTAVEYLRTVAGERA